MEIITSLLNNNNTEIQEQSISHTKEPVEVEIVPSEGTEVITEHNFTYEGYQVVRGEFFAHMYEPSITFNNCKVSLNTACIKKLPTVNYVQILVNPEDMKLAVRPCQEDDKDSFLWCTEKNGKRKPKQITCRLFFAKLVSLMNWNPNYRYKMLGKIIKSGDEYLILFDLKATETYQKIEREGQKPKTSRTPIFPAEWQDQFGLPVEEHKKLLQVNIFKDYTVFGIQDKKPESTTHTEKTHNVSTNNLTKESQPKIAVTEHSSDNNNNFNGGGFNYGK